MVSFLKISVFTEAPSILLDKNKVQVNNYFCIFTVKSSIYHSWKNNEIISTNLFM